MANYDLTAMKGEGITALLVADRLGRLPYHFCQFSTVQKHGGSYSLCIHPGGFKEIWFAANAEETTVDIWCYYETGANPLVDIIAFGSGVALDSQVPSGGAGAWEKLSLTFTPSSPGLFVIRLKNVKFDDGSTALARAFFDDIG